MYCGLHPLGCRISGNKGRGLSCSPLYSQHPSCALLGGRRALQADGGEAGDADPRGAAGAEEPVEAEEQPSGKRQAGSFFQGAGRGLSVVGKLWRGEPPDAADRKSVV